MHFVRGLASVPIAYVAIADPFSPDDLVDAMRKIRAGEHDGLSLDMPIVIDATRALNGVVRPHEVNRLAMQRRAMEHLPANRPVAVIAPNLSVMLMIRLYGVMAHMMGTRDERRNFTTLRTAEAAGWMCRQLRLDAKTAGAFRVELAGLASQTIQRLQMADD